MTPTAIVFFMSLIANLPRGGYSEYVSQLIGLIGFITTIAESFDFMLEGFY
jgi:hypothetical protein